jgi:hypothetical protein
VCPLCAVTIVSKQKMSSCLFQAKAMCLPAGRLARIEVSESQVVDETALPPMRTLSKVETLPKSPGPPNTVIVLLPAIGAFCGLTAEGPAQTCGRRNRKHDKLIRRHVPSLLVPKISRLPCVTLCNSCPSAGNRARSRPGCCRSPPSDGMW